MHKERQYQKIGVGLELLIENNDDLRNACAKSRIYKSFWHNRLQCQSYQR